MGNWNGKSGKGKTLPSLHSDVWNGFSWPVASLIVEVPCSNLDQILVMLRALIVFHSFPSECGHVGVAMLSRRIGEWR
jgi:hypothetical protein